jgi:2-polyprenyl-3-methyl-5-hydroxy-6-metoxy-1,4-benzoquinol methylase
MQQLRHLSHFQGKEPILEQILRQIRFLVVRHFVKQNSTVLDLGCGYDGEFLRSISSKIKSGVGYDLSVRKNKVARNINLYSKRIDEKLVLPKNYFDLITSLAVFEHLRKAQEILKKSYHSLKTDGILVITTPSPRAKIILEFLAFKLNLISRQEISDHKHYYSKREIRRVFIKSGFKPHKVKVSYFGLGFNTLIVATK